MNEIWKDIKGYEGYYQVSNFGRVKSLARVVIGKNNRKYDIKEKIVKSRIHQNGYLFVHLCKNGKKKHLSIHRLLAQAFIPNLENKPEVNHKDGNKENNRVENLEWATSKENVHHAFRTGLKIMTKGEKCSWSKLTEKQVSEIKKELKNCYYGAYVKLGKKYNVCPETIRAIKLNKTWKHIKV